MGKKKGNKNRGGLGEDFEDSYEYGADDGEYQDFVKSQKKKHKNRERNFDDYDYGSEYDDRYDDEADDEQYASFNDEDDDREEEVASEYSESQFGADCNSDFSNSRVNSSSEPTYSTNGFKVDKPSGLGKFYHVKATPNGNASDSSSVGNYSHDPNELSSEVTFRPVKAHSEPPISSRTHNDESSLYKPSSQTEPFTDSNNSVEGDGAERTSGFLSRFRSRNSSNVEEEFEKEDVESRRELKAREKSERKTEKESRQKESSSEMTEEELERQIRIDDIKKRLDEIEAELDENRKYTDEGGFTQEELTSLETTNEKLREERKELKKKLRELGGTRFFPGRFIHSFATSSVKTIGKMVLNPSAIWKRRKKDDAEGLTESDEGGSRIDEEREKRLIARQERREQKKLRREEKKRSRMGRNYTAPSDDARSDSEMEDANNPVDGGFDWLRICFKTAGVAVVVTLILSVGYTGYLFLGSDHSGTDGENDAIVQAKGDALENVNAGWLSKLKHKVSSWGKKEDASAPPESVGDQKKKLAKSKNETSASSKKKTDDAKNKLDEFSNSLMAQTDSLKDDLEEGASLASQKVDEFSERFASAYGDASDSFSKGATDLGDGISEIVDSGRQTSGNFSDSLQDIDDEIVANASDAMNSLGNTVNDLTTRLDKNASDSVAEQIGSFDNALKNDSWESTNFSSSYSADSLPEEDELETVDLDPAAAEFSFGSAPVRNPSATSATTDVTTSEPSPVAEWTEEVDDDPSLTAEDDLTTVASTIPNTGDLPNLEERNMVDNMTPGDKTAESEVAVVAVLSDNASEVASISADLSSASARLDDALTTSFDESASDSMNGLQTTLQDFGDTTLPAALSGRSSDPLDDSALVASPQDETPSLLNPQTESSLNSSALSNSALVASSQDESPSLLNPQTESSLNSNALSNSALVASPQDETPSLLNPQTESSLNSNALSNSSLVVSPHDETPSLLNPQTDYSEGNEMVLSVSETSNATLELDDDSDMNALSGATKVVADDFDSWDSGPSLLSSQNTPSNMENSLLERVNDLNSRGDSLVEKITEASESFQTGLQDRFDSFNQSLNNTVASFQEGSDELSSSLNNSLNSISNTLEQTGESLKENYDNITNSLANSYQSASESFQNIGNNVSNNIQRLQDSFENVNGLNALGNASAEGLALSSSPTASFGSANNSLSSATNDSLVANSVVGTARGASSLLASSAASSPNLLNDAPTNVLQPQEGDASASSPSTSLAPSNMNVANSLSSAETIGNNASFNTVATSNNDLTTNAQSVSASTNVANNTNSVVVGETPDDSDANELVPLSVDYSYSMSPLGRLDSRNRIASSILATPSASLTTGTASFSVKNSVVNNATEGSVSAGATALSAPQFISSNQNAFVNQYASSNVIQSTTSPMTSVTASSASGTVPAGFRLYVTKEGDNLLMIAENELGSSSRWGEIKRINNLRSGATYFEVGTKLLLPDAEQTTRK